MRRVIFSAWLLVSVLFVSAAVAADGSTKLKTAWLGENEAFPVWLAKETGVDRRYGLDISMLRFTSGKEIVESLPAYDWVIAGCGALPALTAALSDKIAIIAAANDESAANIIVARAGNPALQSSPERNSAIRGSAETVQGTRIICPKGTSAHYLLDSWLHALGLKGSAIRMEDMPPAKGMGAFAAGVGDLAVFWAPQSIQARDKGFNTMVTGKDLNILLPVVLIADKKFAHANPRTVKAFLKMYFETTENINAGGPETFAADYQRFFREWAGVEISLEEAAEDLKNHKLFTLRENIELFEAVNGISPIRRELENIGAFADEALKLRVKINPADITGAFLEGIKSGE